jgi:cytochrome bd-I ubiquinol oxidase subunit X
VGVPCDARPGNAGRDPPAYGSLLSASGNPGENTSMWYFSWILGTGLALAFGVLNAIWYEIMDSPSEQGDVNDRSSGAPGVRDTAPGSN